MPAKSSEAGDRDGPAGVEIGRGRELRFRQMATSIQVNTRQHDLPWPVRPSPVPDRHLGHAVRACLAARDQSVLYAQGLGYCHLIKPC